MQVMPDAPGKAKVVRAKIDKAIIESAAMEPDQPIVDSESSGKDRLYLSRESAGADFSFDSGVASVFDDMIERSVPLYRDVQRVTVDLARRFYIPGTAIVDVGCSTGTTLLGLAALPPATLIGIDNSAAMLERCRAKLLTAGVADRVELIAADAQGGVDSLDPRISVAVLNYTLQFITPARRPALLASICSKLVPGGVLIVSEKVRSSDPGLERAVVDLHYDFKRANGYSDLEISRKRDAIEQVLIPWTLEQNCSALAQAGYAAVEPVLKWFQFTTFVAVKLS